MRTANRRALSKAMRDEKFKDDVVSAIELKVRAMRDAELRISDDESPEEVAERFVASRRVRNEWDAAVGPFLDTAGLIAWLELGSRQNVSNAVERGDVLGVPVGARRLYPQFQFSDSGQMLPRLRELLPILQQQMHDPWTQALWLNTTVPQWGNRSPAELLHRGDHERVMSRARADVERRAS